MNTGKTTLAAFAALASFALSAVPPSAFSVDGIFTDHMVLQRRRPVRLSGTAAAGVIVTVRLGEGAARVQADASGRWSAELPAMEAGGPYEVEVLASPDAQSRPFSTIRLRDVMVGEVWVASGQSNMEFWVLGENLESPRFYHLPDGEAVAAEKDPDLRVFYVPRALSIDGPCANPPSGTCWKRADTREANGRCSAVALWFARELRRQLGGVPVGIVSSSWGGSRIQAWMPDAAFRALGDRATLGALEGIRQPAFDASKPRATSAEELREGLRQAMKDWLVRFRMTAPRQTAEARREWGRPDADLSQWRRAPRGEMEGLLRPGAAWYRFDVEVPASWKGRAKIHLDYVNDLDETYLDGVLVGATTEDVPEYWKAPRDYEVADLAPGRHVVAVRAEDHYLTGEIGPNLWIENAASGERLPLGTGDWLERVEFVADIGKIGPRPQDVAGTVVEPRYDYQSPTTLYNAMIAPVAAMNVGGAIWYQGCSNAGDPEGYVGMQEKLIEAWRAAFRDPAMPFVITQLSAWKAHRPADRLPDDFWKGEANPAGCVGFGLFRLAQDRCRLFPKVGVACTVDIGDHSDIHPSNKREVGRRLAHEAMRVAYGDLSFAPGPRAASVVRDGGALVVAFSDAEGGLALDGGGTAFHPHLFSLAGADGRHAWADGELLADGHVRVSCGAVADPRTVRYCVSAYPPGVAFRRKSDGLPVYPFEISVGGPAIVRPAVEDEMRPLPPGAVKLTGGLAREVELVRRNWCLAEDMPLRAFENMYRDGRPVFATGEMWGKFVRSAAMFCRYEPTPELKDLVTGSIARLLAFQQPNGSLSCARAEDQPDGRGGDLWERKYVMLAMERAYECVARDPAILASLRRQADAIVAQVGDGPGQVGVNFLGWSFNHIESSTLLEPFVRLWRLTGERRYLDFATYIVEAGGARGADIFENARRRVRPRDMAGKYPKAYEMLSVFEGAAEYYRATGDEKVRDAVFALFESVLEREITIVGNGGGDAPWHYGVLGEAWDDTAFEQTHPKMKRMMETCTGVTWMKFCSQVLRLSGDPRAADAIERYVYNGLVGAMRPGGDGFSYVNLLNGAKVTNKGWGYTFKGRKEPVTCCNLNGATGVAYIPYVAVMDSGSGPVVNLYNPLRATTEKADLSVETDYPASGEVALTLDEVRSDTLFTVRLRIPAWSERTSLKVNGEAQPAPARGAFAAVTRRWRRGDRIELSLDMRARRVPGPMCSDPAGRDFQAVVRGPVVLARDERTDPGYAGFARILADGDGVVAARRIDPLLPSHRLEFEVPVVGGSIRMCDYASVDCWDGSHVMTWIPYREDFASLSTFACSSEEANRRFADPAQAQEVFCRYLGARLGGEFPAIDSLDFDPKPLDGVVWAKGTLETRRGPVELAWRLDDEGKVVRNHCVAWGIWGGHGSVDEKGRLAGLSAPGVENAAGEMVDGLLRVSFDLRVAPGKAEPCVLELPHPDRWSARLSRRAPDGVHAAALGGDAAFAGPGGAALEQAVRALAFGYYGRRPAR